MKHFYQDIPGYFTWPAFYSHLAIDAFTHGFKRGVEVGTCNGTSLAYLGVELIVSGAKCIVDGVDTSNGNGHAAANLKPLLDAGVIGKLHSCLSWDAAALYADASLDFVFIDADHAYESVLKDIKAWLPKVKPGGLIAGHDYSQDFPGVMLAVAECFAEWRVHRGEKYPAASELQPVGKQYFPVWYVNV